MILLLVGLAGALLIAGTELMTTWNAPASAEKAAAVVIEIHRGESPNEITHELAEKGTLKSPRLFTLLGRLTRSWKKLKAGEYEVSANMTPMQILATLTSGISRSHPLTIREGENMYEVARALEKLGLPEGQKFLGLCKDPAFMRSLGFQEPLPLSLEGYLYPETYFLNRTMKAEEMVRIMVKRSLSFWNEAELTEAKRLGLSRHDAVILASMIEKETGAPQERPLISSVFHNRLRKKMRLQSDPTTIYGIWESYDGNLRRSDLLKPSPFNTYTVNALPAGPISNPGKEALEAALRPATSQFLFFVSRNDGTHEFTTNLAAHNAAVGKLQRDPKAREGKSWRDLSKKLGAQKPGGSQDAATPTAHRTQ